MDPLTPLRKTAAIFLLPPLLLWAGPLQGKENPRAEIREKTLSFQSETSVTARPDQGVITLHFTAYGWSAAKSRKNVDQLIQKFRDKLAAEKIAVADISLGEAKLKPSYQFNRDLKTQVPSDFLVSRRVTLTVADLNSIDRIMDATLSVGSFTVESVRLTVKDRAALLKALFDKAVLDAKDKGRRMAGAQGAELSELLSVEELATRIEDLDLIQNMDFSLAAAESLKAGAPKDGAEASAAGNAQDADAKKIPPMAGGEDLNTDGVRATTQWKVVFSLR